MLVLTAIVAAIVWTLSDKIQTEKLTEVFTAKLSERLGWQAEKQRILFDRYVKGHHTAVKLFVSTLKINEYTNNNNWPKNQQIKYLHKSPPWLPRLSILRNFVQPRFLILLDKNENIREVYHPNRDVLPAALLKPSKMLLSLSHDQGFLTSIDNKPYLIAIEDILNPQGKKIASLMLASPLDEQFLIASQGSTLSNDAIIALLADQEPYILVSSNPLLIREGAHLNDLKEDYLTIGQGFFDYGAADIMIELVSFISTEEIQTLTQEVLTEERTIRAFTAVAFLASFILIMFLVTRRLKKFTRYVDNLTKELSNEVRNEKTKGDEIANLETNFHYLAKTIKTETQALEYQALHDPLTELPNRKLLYNRLQQEILRSERSRKPLVFIISDLNHFKEINDTLGHHIGDTVLQQASTRLYRTFRKTDTVARLGGDEFAILLPETSLDQAKLLTQKAIAAFEIPFVVEGNSLSVGISMGLSESPTHGNDVNILVKRADVAMYIAKRNQLGYSIYDPNQDTHSIGQLALMTELRNAIENYKLEIVYQPKVDLKTLTLFGAEALLRWNHPTRGYISPEEFIPLAEQTGLILPLTNWVLERATLQCMKWKEIWPQFNMAVNLSVHNLQDSKLLDQVRGLILKYSLPTSSLTLEITEGAIMTNPIRAKETLESLSLMGIVLSIDDFGTGYSSLSYLKQLPVEEIKIDKSFVMEMNEDENDAVIVKATIDLAHNLGLKIVAEGVKDHATWLHLKRLNCDIAQGYFISPPVSAEEFTEIEFFNKLPKFSAMNHS